MRQEREEGKRRNGSQVVRTGKEAIDKKAEKKGKVLKRSDERKKARQSPVEQLWERSRVERKETDRKPSTQNQKEGTGNQAGKMEKNLGSVSGTGAPE